VSCGPGLSWQSSPSWGPNCTTAWWLYPGCLQGGCDPAPCTPWPTCYPFPTGGWFPSALPSSWAAPPGPWMGAACPQMLVGGACCKGCEGGGACSAGAGQGSAEPCCQGCAAGEGCNCKATERVGAVYVSDDELNALGEQIAKMGADVDVAAKAAAKGFAEGVAQGTAMKACRFAGLKWDVVANHCTNEADPTGASYKALDPALPLTHYQLERWTPFQLKWNGYRAQTLHEPTVYDSLRTEFATLLGDWTGPLGQKTAAVVPARPPGLLTEEGLKQATGSLPWGWIVVGGAVLLLPFYLPVLTGLYLFLTRGKSLGLAMKAAA